jgi:hypothetical protein
MLIPYLPGGGWGSSLPSSHHMYNLLFILDRRKLPSGSYRPNSSSLVKVAGTFLSPLPSFFTLPSFSLILSLSLLIFPISFFFRSFCLWFRSLYTFFLCSCFFLLNSYFSLVLSFSSVPFFLIILAQLKEILRSVWDYCNFSLFLLSQLSRGKWNVSEHESKLKQVLRVGCMPYR